MNRTPYRYHLAAALALITLCVYLPALRNEFVNLDDVTNIVRNQNIRALNAPLFRWALTDITDYWRPLVWISHAVDYALWGLNPVGHHLANILLHVVNTFLVTLLIVKLLDAARPERPIAGRAAVPDERSILIAAGAAGLLFGIHPIHVASVALAAARTDVLYSLFFLSSALVYASYAGHLPAGESAPQSRFFMKDGRYLLSLVLFTLSLACKPMAVTLPAILLLLDWYPFRRIHSVKSLRTAIIEKIPYGAFSLAGSVLAVIGSVRYGTLQSSDAASLLQRMLMASKTLVSYIADMAYPLSLLPFYSTSKHALWSLSEYRLPLTVVVILTLAALYSAVKKKQKTLLTIWVYYGIALLPVLGIIKVRPHIKADQYTYLPSLGPFLLVGLAATWLWSQAGKLKEKDRWAKRFLLGLAFVIVVALSLLTIRQIGVWHDSVTLWSLVLKKSPERVSIALNSRGLAYAELGQNDRALDDLDEAVKIDPNFVNAHISRGWMLWKTGHPEQAVEEYTIAIKLEPLRDLPYNSRGLVLQEMGQPGLAIADYTAAIERNPEYALAYVNRGLAYEQEGRIDLALDDYSAAIATDEFIDKAYNNRGLLFERTGRYGEALEDFNKALTLNPASVEAISNRGLVYENVGRFPEAVQDYTMAINLNPSDSLSYLNRGIAYGKEGDRDHALEDYRKACELGSEAGCKAAKRN